MKRLQTLKMTEFEIEHPLYLARIRKVFAQRYAKVMLDEFEQASAPVFAIQVWYLPKFDRVTLDGHNNPDLYSIYRVLYEVSVTIGESHLQEDIDGLTFRASCLALLNPDPANWKEEIK